MSMLHCILVNILVNVLSYLSTHLFPICGNIENLVERNGTSNLVKRKEKRKNYE